MSLREILNRAVYLRGAKRVITPLWIWINGRTGQDSWLSLIRQSGSERSGVIFDVGSSDGFFFRKAFAHFPEATYHHFEPRPEAAARLRSLVAKLRAASTVHEVALADESGRTAFAVMDYGDASSLLVSTQGVGTNVIRQIDVPVEPLDALFDDLQVDRVGLLKIDVEGVEKRVLLGAQRTLTQRVASVILEISALRHVGGADETLAVFKIMFDAGFWLVDTYNCDYFFTKDPGVLARYNVR